MDEEIWKDVKGYEENYQVSNLGKVRSVKFNKIKILKQNKIGVRSRETHITLLICVYLVSARKLYYP